MARLSAFMRIQVGCMSEVAYLRCEQAECDQGNQPPSQTNAPSVER